MVEESQLKITNLKEGPVFGNFRGKPKHTQSFKLKMGIKIKHVITLILYNFKGPFVN